MFLVLLDSLSLFWFRESKLISRSTPSRPSLVYHWPVLGHPHTPHAITRKNRVTLEQSVQILWGWELRSFLKLVASPNKIGVLRTQEKRRDGSWTCAQPCLPLYFIRIFTTEYGGSIISVSR